MENSFLKEFKEREYYNQCTNEIELENIMGSSKIKAYIGFDCTAQSLHVGSLLQIMCLRLLQKFGHQPIVLLGGGTTRIGDPSGKEETRKILSEKEIEKNIKNIQNVFKIFLKTKNPKTKPIFVNNFKWLGKLNYIRFLRDIGKHFTINKMLSFDSVKLRLDREQSLSYMEFNYMILQAYDFLELSKTKKCILQIGGSDQWGNIVLGMEIISKINKKDAFGLTTPLLTTSTGKKMGKTEQGAVWIDQNKYSSYDFYQYWRNVDDNDVEKLLLIFSDLNKSEIKSIISENINEAKKKLAFLVTSDCHSQVSAEEAEKKAISIFENNSDENLDEIVFDKNEDIKIIDALTRQNLVNSKSEAKRYIEGGAIKLNDQVINDFNTFLNIKNNDQVLRIGKKKLFKLKFN